MAKRVARWCIPSRVAVAAAATLLAGVGVAVPPPPVAPATGPASRSIVSTTTPASASVTSPTLPATTSAASRPALPAIPRDVLDQMYRRELGDRYNPADADRLYQAHALVERYFEASTAKERQAIVGQLRATRLDANLVGRITRLRMHWPELDGGGVYYVNERVGPHVVRYFFGVPERYDRAKPWPLVIKLPTAHAFLTEPRPDADRVADIYVAWVKEELRLHPDAVVMMPLLNLSELYGPSYAGMNTVIQPLRDVADRANVDPAQVYLQGHAMAAHGAWNLALHYPTYFAAINPMAGGARHDWQRLRVINLRNVLPVVWHDADDQVVKVDAGRGIVRAMKLQKLDVDYTETKGVGHAPDARTQSGLYEKMRSRFRDLYPKQVALQSNRPDTMFNRADWVQVWQAINPGKEHSYILQLGSGTMLLSENTHRIDASRPAANRIEVTTQNVDSFRVYLNDRMIDFAKPVTLVLNRRPVFEGTMTADVDAMLKDQLFLGRGWRYYTAALDVDVVARPKPPTRPATRPTSTRATTTGPATRPTGRIIVGPAARE